MSAFNIAWVRAAIILVVVALAGAPMALASTGAPERVALAQTTTTFCVTDDARVEEASPTNNYGSGKILAIDTPSSVGALGLVHTYLKFNVAIPTGNIVTGATLHLQVRTTGTNGTNYSVNVHSVADTTWTEGTLNWNNRPAMGGVVASLPAPLSIGQVVSQSLPSSAFSGPGLYSLGLAYPAGVTHSDGIDFSSKEDVSPGPCLEVTYTLAPAGTVPAAHYAIEPAQLCADLTGQTNPIIRASVPAGTVPNGNVFCRVLAEDGSFPNPLDSARLGDPGLVQYGVIHAVDVFGVTATGQSYPDFEFPITVCLQGTGRFIYLNALNAPRTTFEMPAAVQGDFTCATIPAAGTIVLIPALP